MSRLTKRERDLVVWTMGRVGHAVVCSLHEHREKPSEAWCDAAQVEACNVLNADLGDPRAGEDMLRFVLDHRKAVDDYTGDRRNDLRQFELTAEEWKVIEQLCDVLEVSVSFHGTLM